MPSLIRVTERHQASAGVYKTPQTTNTGCYVCLWSRSGTAGFETFHTRNSFSCRIKEASASLLSSSITVINPCPIPRWSAALQCHQCRYAITSTAGKQLIGCQRMMWKLRPLTERVSGLVAVPLTYRGSRTLCICKILKSHLMQTSFTMFTDFFVTCSGHIGFNFTFAHCLYLKLLLCSVPILPSLAPPASSSLFTNHTSTCDVSLDIFSRPSCLGKVNTASHSACCLFRLTCRI